MLDGTVCILRCGWLSVKMSRSDSPGPSFHYHSFSLPDTYNPITFYSSAPAWASASLHRHKHIDPTSELANIKGRHNKSQIHSHTINREGSVHVFKANSDKLYQSDFTDITCGFYLWLTASNRQMTTIFLECWEWMTQNELFLNKSLPALVMTGRCFQILKS